MKINIIKFDEVKDISIQDYFSNEGFAADMFKAKYSLEKQDGNKETPAEVFLRIASGLSEMETDDNNKIKYCDIWFSLLWEGWWRPGGSIISGVGSTERVSLNNCTYLPIEGDSLDDISECRKNLMKCAALRQGLGILGDPLRPKGSIVNNSAKYSTGSVPWLDDLVAIGKKVGQMGRMPALLAALGIHHPDIEEFISCKDDLEFMNNANLSVQISDEFMDAVEKDEEWELKFDIKSSNEQVRKTINARKLFTTIAEHAKKSAEPGVQYIDSMRKGSMVQCIANATGDDTYRIEGSNACCFTEDNRIFTDKGNITIKELKHRLEKGEKFKSLSKNIIADKEEYKDILHLFERDNGLLTQTITLNLENGKSIECTLDHKFYTKNRGIVQAKDLTIEDELIDIINRNSFKNGRGYCGYHNTWDNKNIFCRSVLEKIQCLLLDKQQKYYLLEKECFDINGKSYKPDFFIYEDSNYKKVYEIIEIKDTKEECELYHELYYELYYEYFKNLNIQYKTNTFDRRLYYKSKEYKFILEEYKNNSNSYSMSGKNNPAYGIKFTNVRIKEHSKIMSECQNRPEVRKKHSEATKKFFRDNPDYKKLLSKKQKDHQEYLRIKKYGNKKENKCIFCGNIIYTYEKIDKQYCVSKSCKGKWCNYLAKKNGTNTWEHTKNTKFKIMKNLLIKHGIKLIKIYTNINRDLIKNYKFKYCRLKSRFSENSIKKYFGSLNNYIQHVNEEYYNEN